MDNLKLEQTISKLNLENLEIVLKMIWKQIIKLNGKPEEIIKITLSFSDIEKEKWANGIACIWCDSKYYWKNGHNQSKNLQRYKCKKCMKTFDCMTGTFLSYSHLSMEQLTKLIQCIILKLTCKKTGEICSLSEQHSWKQRIKILKLIDKFMSTKVLSGITWLDETYILQNYKGNWKNVNKPEKIQEKEEFFLKIEY